MLKIADMRSVVQIGNVAAAASTLLHSPGLFPTWEQVVRGQFPDVCCICERAHSRHYLELIFLTLSGVHA